VLDYDWLTEFFEDVINSLVMQFVFTKEQGWNARTLNFEERVLMDFIANRWYGFRIVQQLSSQFPSGF